VDNAQALPTGWPSANVAAPAVGVKNQLTERVADVTSVVDSGRREFDFRVSRQRVGDHRTRRTRCRAGRRPVPTGFAADESPRSGNFRQMPPTRGGALASQCRKNDTALGVLMNTSLRASRVGLASGALLVAVALSACGVASSGAGGGAAVTPPSASSSAPSASGGANSASASAASGPATGAPATPTTASTVTVPSGGPVPRGFAATSVTFVSSQEAFVLGTAPCANAPCTSILRTLDRGASWRGLPAPVVPLESRQASGAGPTVWGIRFANPSDGFVFGNGLWATTDGGEHWALVASPGGSIVSLEITDGQVLALTTVCTPPTACPQKGILLRRPLAGGAWQTVAHVTDPGAIGTQAQVAAVLDGSSVIVTTNGGSSTASHAVPCNQEGIDVAASLAVTGPSGLALLCAGDAGMGSVTKTVYVSDDLGAHWTKAGSPARGGDPEGISAGSASQFVAAAASGASMLYYSADGGAQWTTAYDEGDGGLGFSDLGFTTATDGVVVYGPVLSDNNAEGRPGRLLLTSNGGASWQPVSY
jgi:hypothetical protein